MHVTTRLGAAAIVLWQCSSGSPSRPVEIEGELLGPEALAELDAIRPEPPGVDDVILPDGQKLVDYAHARGIERPKPRLNAIYSGSTSPKDWPRGASRQVRTPQQEKNDTITEMILFADTYADRSLWRYGATSGPNDGPAQDGLAYSYGSKDTDRHEPPAGTCHTRVHGLDCSGLVYLSATFAGLQVPTGTAEVQSDPKVWKVPVGSALAMQRLEDASYETGDIVSWIRPDRKVHHIGIVEIGNAIRVYQSHGSAGPEPEQCRLDREDLYRGPAKLLLAEVNATHCGAPTSHLRLVTCAPPGTYAGEWIESCDGHKTFTMEISEQGDTLTMKVLPPCYFGFYTCTNSATLDRASCTATFDVATIGSDGKEDGGRYVGSLKFTDQRFAGRFTRTRPPIPGTCEGTLSAQRQ